LIVYAVSSDTILNHLSKPAQQGLVMNFETIVLSTDDGLAKLTLNRPEKLNCFNVQMHEEIRTALGLVQTQGMRALLITGAGRGFCAGQDLADRTVLPGGTNIDLGETVEQFYNPLIETISSLPLPVICAVNGVAAGAGANIALACDIVIAGASAKFIESFATIGLVPDSGGSWILPRLIGQARALGLTLTGEPLSATQAAEWGLIWKVVPDASLQDESISLAKKLAEGPTLGLARTKQAIRGASTRSLHEQLKIERDFMRELGQSADYQEGVDAFLTKRRPIFIGK
jgi:2-(1,2-epoxy-1,2-dihydrophenyl)acetyl-CoA isomerase